MTWQKLFSFHKLLLIIFLLLILILPKYILAQDPADKLKDLTKQIEEYENKINDLKGQQKTLVATMQFLDSQIQLTLAKISQTEVQLKILAEEIGNLSVKINILDKSITDVSNILSSRIEATYKRGNINPLFFFFSSQKFADFLSRIKYLKIAQYNDQELLYTMQQSKMNYDNQKLLKEQKQAEQEKLQKQLVVQQSALAQQKQAKQQLLNITKNDEKKFQQLLATAKAEMNAIQSILAGNGQETKVGDIREGEKIASVGTYSEAPACSSGEHLHFEVVKESAHNNPANYLKSISIIWNNKPDGEFSFSGSWNWPISEPVRITQGYGMTHWAQIGWYGGGPHTGIDIVSDSNNGVKAVNEGVLYRGSIACGGGILRYVKVDHKNTNITTYYLHVNYNQ